MTESVIDIFDRVADRYDDVLPFFSELGRFTAQRLPEPEAGGRLPAPRLQDRSLPNRRLPNRRVPNRRVPEHRVPDHRVPDHRVPDHRVPDHRLLDIGAGRGAIAVPARQRGYAVTAVDAAPGMVTRLRQEQPALDVRLMDAARLEFPDASFDVVTAGLVMHLVDDAAAVTREVRRVLRPGGLFAFTTPGPVPAGFEFADGANALFGEFARYLPPQGSMGVPFDEVETLTGAGLVPTRQTDLRVELPVADAETLWQWFQTHGTRKYFEDLPAGRRDEFRRRLIDDLEGRPRPLVLRRYAWLHEARKND